MVCCIASLPAPRSAPICGNAGKNGVDRERPEHRQRAKNGGQATVGQLFRGGLHPAWYGTRQSGHEAGYNPARAWWEKWRVALLPKAQPPGIAQARYRRVTTLWRDRQHTHAGAEGARSRCRFPSPACALPNSQAKGQRGIPFHGYARTRMSPMTTRTSLRTLEHHDAFIERHIGPNDAEIATMLAQVGHDSLEAFTDAIVPASIKSAGPLALPEAITEVEALAKIRAIAQKNQVFRSFIGQGYYGTHTPNVILRNILENPAWYTAYTPYQAEISQGRMEALINFQTMCADLTGMEIANASLLDEATAAAEAMTLAKRSAKSKSNTFLVAGDTHPQTLEVLHTRAEPLGIDRGGRAFHRCLPPEARRRRLLRRAGAVPGIQRLDRGLDRGCRSHPRPWRAVRRRHRPAGADPAQAAGRDGRRHRGRQHPALRRAVRLRWPACGLHGLPRRLQALDARPPDRRVDRCRGQARPTA